MRIPAIILASLMAAGASADGWTRFRGPNGSGVADGQAPPTEFGPRKNVKWMVATPPGQSSPIVAGGNIILTGFENGKLLTIAYDRNTGRVAWKADARASTIEPFQKDAASPAIPTPATDGKRIVVYFGSCGLICYSLSGKELWRYKLPTADIYGNYGSGVSPIIAGGYAVLVRDVASGSSVIAIDINTGKRCWETKRLSRCSWCTPVIWKTPDGTQVVSAGHGAMTGYDLKTGAEKWHVNQMPAGCASSPVVDGQVVYFAGWTPGAAGDTSFQMEPWDTVLKNLDKNKDGVLTRDEAGKAWGSFFDNFDLNRDGKVTREEYEDQVNLMLVGKNGVYALKPGEGDITNSHMLWKRNRGMGYIPTAILYRGRLVMVKDGGIVTALDAKTGDTAYSERLGGPGEYHASPVAANGYIYFASLQGVMTVMKAGPGSGRVVTKTPRLDDKIAATPAIADNTLYVRTNAHLYAFKAK